MRLYIDANVLISMWMDEISKGNLPIYFGYYSERMLESAIECKYDLVMSKLVISEILEKYKFLKNSLSTLTNRLRCVGKLEVVNAPDELVNDAFNLDKKLKKENIRVGWKDCFHLLLAKQKADVFVTWDKQLRKIAEQLDLKFKTPEKL